MIEKYARVEAVDPVNGQQIFILPAAHEKTASLVKEAQVAPEIEEAIRNLEKRAGHAYVLVNALGAYEHWGPNRNHDAFTENGLKYGSDEYGYRTFNSARVNLHHDNKDPAKGVGTVKAAHYNDEMHRVELLLDIDMAKVKGRDPDIHEKIANGEPCDFSMGCKCDYDVCTQCGNKAANRSEYCPCLMKHGGEILPDGRRIAAYTPHPRFFDISAVTKGADVTAKSLHYIGKVASEGGETRADAEAKKRGAACPDPSMHESVSCEQEDPEFPASHKNAVFILEAVEPSIPAETLNALAKSGFAEALSTASHFGIIYRPEEYQRIALAALGLQGLADRLDKEGAVIDITGGTWFDADLQAVPEHSSADRLAPRSAELLAAHVAERSAWEPFFSHRLAKAARIPTGTITKLASSRSLRKTAGNVLTPEIAAALSLGYLIYRKGVPAASTDAIEKAIKNPEMAKKVVAILIPLIAAGSVVDAMFNFRPPTGKKTAGVASNVLLPVGGTYLYSAYARRKAEQGRPVTGLQHLFIDYPLPLALAGVAGMSALSRKMKGTKSSSPDRMSDAMKKRADFATDMVLGFGSGAYRARLSGLLGILADAAVFSGAAKAAKGVAGVVAGGREKQQA